MISHETAIAERLRDAASRIDVDTDVSDVIELRRTTAAPSSIPRRRVLAGIAVAATAAALVVAVRLAPNDETLEAGPAADATSSAAAYAAHVVSPPEWFGEPRGAHREGGIRTGRWVSMAIARHAGERVSAPIVLSVFDGTYEPLGAAETVTIDGVPRRSIRFDGWQALATDGTPTVLVSGSVDEETLGAVLDAVEVIDPSGDFSVRLPSPPAGYAEIVAARVLRPDAELRPTLASESGDVGINEVSDWTSPLLYAASTGADLTAVDLDGVTGWIGLTTSNPTGPLRFLVWSPRPGVVFEITTHDMARTELDLVDLARTTSALRMDDWTAIYGS